MSWKKDGRSELDIGTNPSLNSEEREVEEEFAEWIQEDVGRAVVEYAKIKESEGGKIVNTDHARQLSDDYSGAWESRLKWGDAVHEPASSLANEVYRRRVDASSIKDLLVIFTAGGPGAGKSTALEKLGPDVKRIAHTIYDGTLADLNSAVDRIDPILDDGLKWPMVIYVHRPVGLVWI